MNNNHQKTKLKLKILGILLLIVSLTLTVIGFATTFDGNGNGQFFWMCFIGLPLLPFSIFLLVISHQQEINRFIKNETTPIINETAKEISPAIQSVTSSVKATLDNSIICSCSAINAAGRKFCKSCGKALNFICDNCGASLDTDSKFCSNCGKKL